MYSRLTNFIDQQILSDDRIIGAFKHIDRKDFLPSSVTWHADYNSPVHIGHGQTNSQPYTVAYMLELLQPKTWHNILDIGSGSWWTTALLAHIVGDTWHVVSIERIPEIATFGKENIEKYQYISNTIVTHLCADGTKGYPDRAPYDRILVSAMAKEIPPALTDQLTPQGRLVIPYQDSMYLITKDVSGKLTQHHSGGFIFVPLVTDETKTE